MPIASQLVLSHYPILKCLKSQIFSFLFPNFPIFLQPEAVNDEEDEAENKDGEKTEDDETQATNDSQSEGETTETKNKKGPLKRSADSKGPEPAKKKKNVEQKRFVE